MLKYASVPRFAPSADDHLSDPTVCVRVARAKRRTKRARMCVRARTAQSESQRSRKRQGACARARGNSAEVQERSQVS